MIYYGVYHWTPPSAAGARIGPAMLPMTKSMLSIRPLRNCPRMSLLVVASHNPIIVPDENSSTDDPDWLKARVWMKRARALLHRIEIVREGRATLWLSGDVHAPDDRLEGGIYHVINSRFGTSAKKSNIPRQAKLVVYDTAFHASRIVTFSYDMPKGWHYDDPERGEWAKYVRAFRDRRVIVSTSEPKTIVDSGVGGSPVVAPVVECLNSSLEDQIIALVGERQLYHFGRFHTAKDRVSLAWVSIGPILNESGIFALVIARMAEFIRRHVPDAGPDNTALQDSIAGAQF